jgi:DnaD/phage-associated family protein
MTPVEMEFINRWYDDYGFDKDMVAEACKRTIISMSKPNFSYADGILKKWRSAKVYTMEDLKTLDAGFRAKITIPVTTKPVQQTKTTNKFNNFNQRTYNFEELEKKLISNN